MRVPLDYYRILGLPLQATVDQIQQAHHDRLLQLHRRGYSESAITARKQLIDQAYAVLSDIERRQSYNATFLGRSSSSELSGSESTSAPESTGSSAQEGMLSLPQFSAAPQGQSAERASSDRPSGALTPPPKPPNLEIKDELLIGALMILLELGDYEAVLTLAQPHLGSRGISFKHLQQGEPSITQVDLVLTVALAYLELGREQWHRGQYENAAASLDAGQDLLLREGVFANLRGEIQADLYKLRPYRILELLALSNDHVAERRHGLKLLCDMLQERGGIDGTGKDQSGLTVDDFLRFIQQLRSYLTAAEQQLLFEEEARRPSAVATYLAVYALIARGFVEYQPALIRRAKAMLSRLSSRQDVYLEQAVCSLLLGQTLEANRALEASREEESLLFIEEHSQGSPDLLPGLCLYSERWLQEEVFPHFRDLVNRKASLKDYFADEQVQAYLEELPNESPASTNDWEVVRTSRVSAKPTSAGQTGASEVANKPTNGWKPSSDSAARSQPLPERNLQPSSPSRNSNFDLRSEGPAVTTPGYSANGTRTATTREWEGVTPPAGSDTQGRRASSENRPPQGSRPRTNTGGGRGASEPPGPRNSDRPAPHTTPSPAPSSVGKAQRSSSTPGSTASASERGGRSFLIGLLSLLVLGGLALAAVKVYQMLATGGNRSDQPVLQGDQPMVELNRPIINIPAPETISIWKAPLDKKNAEQIIQTWLDAKAAAMGQNHDPSKLKQVLTDPVLSKFQRLSAEAKRDDWYWQYKYKLSINSVQFDEAKPNLGEIEASVKETAELFENGVLNQAASADRDLRVRYKLIRQNGEWRIQDIVVLR